jgi:actin related protein 2/3 complex subunit 1A/1B
MLTVRPKGHDSIVTIVYTFVPSVITMKMTTLPYVTLIWTSEDALIAVGHDCQPVLYPGSASGLEGYWFPR